VSRIAGTVQPSPEDVHLSPPPNANGGVWLGVEVEAHESDSLDDLEALPGVRVRAVDRGGPADRAGLRAGDIVLRVDGVRVDDRDGFEAISRTLAPGTPCAIELRRDTVGVEVSVAPVERPSAAPAPQELCRVDPLHLRASFRTSRVRVGADERTAVEVRELFAESPLAAAGVRPGDRFVAFDGETLSSAQDLVTRSLAHEPGDAVTLKRLRTVDAGGDSVEAADVLELDLWAPDRVLTGLSVPILFTYESRAEPSSTTFRIIDLWLVSLFSYERENGEKTWSFLGLFEFQTGYGELREEAAARRDDDREGSAS